MIRTKVFQTNGEEIPSQSVLYTIRKLTNQVLGVGAASLIKSPGWRVLRQVFIGFFDQHLCQLTGGQFLSWKNLMEDEECNYNDLGDDNEPRTSGHSGVGANVANTAGRAKQGGLLARMTAAQSGHTRETRLDHYARTQNDFPQISANMYHNYINISKAIHVLLKCGPGQTHGIMELLFPNVDVSQQQLPQRLPLVDVVSDPKRPSPLIIQQLSPAGNLRNAFTTPSSLRSTQSSGQSNQSANSALSPASGNTDRSSNQSTPRTVTVAVTPDQQIGVSTSTMATSLAATVPVAVEPAVQVTPMAATSSTMSSNWSRAATPAVTIAARSIDLTGAVTPQSAVAISSNRIVVPIQPAAWTTASAMMTMMTDSTGFGNAGNGAASHNSVLPAAKVLIPIPKIWEIVNEDIATAVRTNRWLSEVGIVIDEENENARCDQPPSFARHRRRSLLKAPKTDLHWNDIPDQPPEADEYNDTVLLSLLRRVVGHKKAIFNEGQSQILREVMSTKGDAFLVARCGWGKQLVYELLVLSNLRSESGNNPNTVVALFLPQRILIDQAVDRAKKNNITHTVLVPRDNGGGISEINRDSLNDVSKINGLLICSMDSIDNKIIQTLNELNAMKRLKRVIVDEAHVPFISANYRNILWKLGLLAHSGAPLLFMSATMTDEMIEVIRTLTHSQGVVIRAPSPTGFVKATTKLCLKIEEDQRDAETRLLDEIYVFVNSQMCTDRFERTRLDAAPKKQYGDAETGRILIMVNSIEIMTRVQTVIANAQQSRTSKFGDVKTPKSMAHFLQPPVVYHASLPNGQKASAIQKWKSGAALIMIGTKAIGVGLDVPNIV
jgi:hypothetical protein